jgi:hypothetical protein
MIILLVGCASELHDIYPMMETIQMAAGITNNSAITRDVTLSLNAIPTGKTYIFYNCEKKETAIFVYLSKTKKKLFIISLMMLLLHKEKSPRNTA